MNRSRHPVVRRIGATLLATGLLVGLTVAPASAVVGASIVVNSTSNAVADDGFCTLREAITAANTNAAFHDCTAGSGMDSITFSVAGTITITSGNEMTDILESVSIDGGGAITIDANGESSGLCSCGVGLTVNLTGLTITGGVLGDAAVVNNGTMTLTRVNVTNNTNPGSGGGLGNKVGDTLTVIDSTISGNQAGDGAGIYVNDGGTVTIVRSTIAGNTATAEGGGIRLFRSSVTVDRSTISGNGAQKGGGILTESTGGTSTLRVWNSTIADNTASDKGGGIYRAGNIEVRNSTIARNAAGTFGGGVETEAGAWTFAMSNAAILGNTANGSASNWSVTSELGAAVHSQVGLAGKTLADFFDPVTLAENGGPTLTLRPRLVAGNTLVDGGLGTACAAAPISGKDQRGYGRVSPCDIGAVDVDKTKPVVSSVKTSLRKGATLSGSSSRARLSWSASDRGSGVATYRVQRKLNGGSWTTIGTGLTARSFDVTLGKGSAYAFRVRASDREGNVGSYAAGPAFTARLYQQTSRAFTYSGGWGNVTATAYSSGSTKTSKTGGSSARFTATGRAFAWITTYGPTRGIAKIYVNGTLVSTVDLNTATTYRVQAWTHLYSSSASRTIKVVVSGSGERVDVDAFAVLQ